MHPGDQTRQAEVEAFAPTNGRLMGWLGVGLCLAVFLLVAIELRSVVGSALMLLVASLVWASMIRPGVTVSQSQLRLHNMVTDTELPLEGVRSVVVRRFLAIGAGGKRYTCPAISRPLRGMLRGGRGASGVLGAGGFIGGAMGGGRGLDAGAPAPSEHTMSYPDYVEERINRLATEARARLGIESGSDEEFAAGDRVRRQPAWLPIALLGVTALALVAGLLL